jgi:hypothetical protein
MKPTTPFTIALLAIASAAMLGQTPTVKPVSLGASAPPAAFVAPTTQPISASMFANDGPIAPGAALVAVGDGWYKAAPSTYEFRRGGKLVATVDCAPNGVWYAHLHASTVLVAFQTLTAAKAYVAK